MKGSQAPGVVTLLATITTRNSMAFLFCNKKKSICLNSISFSVSFLIQWYHFLLFFLANELNRTKNKPKIMTILILLIVSINFECTATVTIIAMRKLSIQNFCHHFPTKLFITKSFMIVFLK